MNEKTSIVAFDDTVDERLSNRKLTKAERKMKRLEENRRWKCYEKAAWSEADPNSRHTQYYKHQLPFLVSEWQLFVSALAKPLSVTLRTGFSSLSSNLIKLALDRKFEMDFRWLNGRFRDGGSSEDSLENRFVRRVSWCDAWKLSCDGTELLKSPPLEDFRAFVHREVSLGNIVRQELVSMIPVLCADVRCHHTVLDMCAAPGSKTQQLLSLVTDPHGMVVANDADTKRIERLCERYSRCRSPNLLVSCSRAEDLLGDDPLNCPAPAFDRIICDVPCSGDGTFRKCPHLWRLFRPRMAVELHSIQLQIARSGVHMLKAGGRLVYSTCSLNPIEDEAVVAQLLSEFQHLRVLDVGSLNILPDLKTRAGIASWTCSTDIFSVGEPNENERKKSIAKLPTLLPSMFPPTDSFVSEQLRNCMRIVPHDQDTGGFFVAVLAFSETGSQQAPCEAPKKFEKLLSSEITTAPMRHMGYNPKPAKIGVASGNGCSSDSQLPTGRFQMLSSEMSEVARGVLGVRDEVEINCTNDNSPSPAVDSLMLLCRTQTGIDEINDIFRASSAVTKAATSWARSNSIEVGTRVATMCKDGSRLRWSFDPDGARYLVDILKPDRVAAIDVRDFLLLCEHALRPNETGSVTISLPGVAAPKIMAVSAESLEFGLSAAVSQDGTQKKYPFLGGNCQLSENVVNELQNQIRKLLHQNAILPSSSSTIRTNGNVTNNIIVRVDSKSLQQFVSEVSKYFESRSCSTSAENSLSSKRRLSKHEKKCQRKKQRCEGSLSTAHESAEEAASSVVEIEPARREIAVSFQEVLVLEVAWQDLKLWSENKELSRKMHLKLVTPKDRCESILASFQAICRHGFSFSHIK